MLTSYRNSCTFVTYQILGKLNFENPLVSIRIILTTKPHLCAPSADNLSLNDQEQIKPASYIKFVKLVSRTKAVES